MRTGRPKAPLMLTAEEQRELESLVHRSRSVPALARRARIVLACAAEQANKTVAHRLRVTPATVGKWRTRFVRARLAGLYDEPRPGAPRHIDDDAIEQVVIRTLESTPRGATHWSTRTLGRQLASATWPSAASGGPLGCSRIAVRPSSCPPIRCWCPKYAYCRAVHEPAGACGGALPR